MQLRLKHIFLGLGIFLFILGLVLVTTFYVSDKGTLDECRKRHRNQAWVTFSVGVFLLIIWAVMNFFLGRSTTTQYY